MTLLLVYCVRVSLRNMISVSYAAPTDPPTRDSSDDEYTCHVDGGDGSRMELFNFFFFHVSHHLLLETATFVFKQCEALYDYILTNCLLQPFLWTYMLSFVSCLPPGPPVIVVPPKSTSLNMSQNALLQCQAVADPPNMTYVWRKDGENVHHIEWVQSSLVVPEKSPSACWCVVQHFLSRWGKMSPLFFLMFQDSRIGCYV